MIGGIPRKFGKYCSFPCGGIQFGRAEGNIAMGNTKSDGFRGHCVRNSAFNLINNGYTSHRHGFEEADGKAFEVGGEEEEV